MTYPCLKYSCDWLSAVVTHSAFNNILSNLGYVMLGLLFLLIVLKRDIIHNRAMDRNDLNALVRHTHAHRRMYSRRTARHRRISSQCVRQPAKMVFSSIPGDWKHEHQHHELKLNYWLSLLSLSRPPRNVVSQSTLVCFMPWELLWWWRACSAPATTSVPTTPISSLVRPLVFLLGRQVSSVVSL